jgi:hypothetical protein
MSDDKTEIAATRLARLEAQKKQIERKLSALRRRESAEARKADARRKILIGAAVLAAVEKSGLDGRRWLSGVLKSNLSDRDQAVLSDLLLPLEEAADETVRA